jgi:hypothetical protein
MLEAYNKGHDYLTVLDAAKQKYDSLFFEEQDTYGNLLEDLNRIMKGYIARYSNDGITYDTIEESFTVPMFSQDENDWIHNHCNDIPDLMFTGKIDGTAHDTNGLTYVIEHKCKSTLPEAGSEVTDLQTVLYVKALEIMGREKPKAILWDYIRTKAPVIPQPLKSGGLSKAKAQDTDFDTYLTAIKANNLNVEEYAEMLDHLGKVKANAFYKRNVMPNPAESLVKSMWEDLEESALQIALHGKDGKVKNITRICKFCSYFNLCNAELFNNNYDYVLKSQYKKKEKKNEVIV